VFPCVADQTKATLRFTARGTKQALQFLARPTPYGIYIGSVFCGCILYADDIGLVLLSSSCYGLQKMLDVCEQYGSLWDIKFNPSKSYACAFGGSHPSNINVTLADRPVKWVTRVKYLGCTMMCRSSKMDVSPLVGKFYVVGTGKNEMASPQLNKSYCLPHLVYCCEAWRIRTSELRAASVAWNNSFRKIFNSCWFESTKSLMFYCQCLPLSYIVHQRRLIYLKKRICFDNVVLQILVRRCFNDVRALCDIYHISVDISLKRSVHYVKALFVHHFITSFYKFF